MNDTTAAVLTITSRVTRRDTSVPVIIGSNGWATEARVPENGVTRLWSPARLRDPLVRVRVMAGRPW